MMLNISSMLIIFLVLFLFSQKAESATIFLDGVSEWKNPNVHVGDTIIFKHKYNYKLYIFKNKNAFNICNFTQATLLTKLNFNSYRWHPSRPGFFYFSFNSGSFKSCISSQGLTIKVSAVSSTIPPSPSPEKPPMMTAPTPASGGGVSSSPAYPWPFRPREAASSPSPEPISAATSPVTVTVPDKGGGIPFINSNPAVPLPTGEVDSATIRPLPTSGHGNQVEVVGILASQILILLFSAIFLIL